MLHTRTKFFNALSLDQAKGRLEALMEDPRFKPSRETVPVKEALGRVLADDVRSRSDSPPCRVAAMDGIMVRAEDTYQASLSNPVRLRLDSQTRLVDTGQPLFDEFDAVIRIEDVKLEARIAEVVAPVVPGQYVREAGEDVRRGQPLFNSGRTLRPADLGLLLAGGHTQVTVIKRPSVALIPVGSELTEPGREGGQGRMIEFNSTMLAGYIRQWGGEVKSPGIVPDDEGAIADALCKSLREDIVVFIAGSSKGRSDLVPSIIEQHGTILFHGVNIMPGRPIVLGKVQGRPVVGLPGYPVSALVDLDLFVKPMIFRLQGLKVPERPKAKAWLSTKIPSKLGVMEFVRVSLRREGEKLVALPLARGAGNLSSWVNADALLRIPEDLEGLPAGSKVEVELLG